MQNIHFQVLLFNFVFPGLGCDTAAVVNILAHRDATQRVLIQQEYRSMYSDDLLKRLSSELHGKLEVAILYVLMNSFRLRSVERLYFFMNFSCSFFFFFPFLLCTQLLEIELYMIVFRNSAKASRSEFYMLIYLFIALSPVHMIFFHLSDSNSALDE